ncbi:MAG: chemotaxis response regulator protein-glutamate methylesterase [Oscillospiraceae bacterium]|jgi:two-component system chemotaxis response regulator CheB|nr:chemotaxis response regulator protein-glutamate methylesterase [Oscillospiraceae bacterium]
MAIRVFIVDDSVFFREMLEKTFKSDTQIEIVGKAGDPYEASEKIPLLNPDVVTLDVEMPKMDGISFLKKLIPQYPIPVVVVSAAPIKAFEAMDAGAVDYIKKPLIKNQNDMKSFAAEMKNKIIIASHAKVRQPKVVSRRPVSATSVVQAPNPTITYTNKQLLIAMGASTGGTDALQTVLQTMPANCPPIVIVQHMPPVFTKMFSERLNKICAIEVVEAKNLDRCRPGVALLAPGDAQLKVHKDVQGYYVKVGGTEKVSGHCPSVDVMFDSVAECAGKNAIGVIMTGMGSDGAIGMKKMRDRGAYNIGQDKDSCVVYGMPMVAYNMGGVNLQVSLEHITNAVVKQFSSK